MAVAVSGKKGMFFTIIAVLIISVLFITFVPRQGATLNDRIAFTESRVSTADGFIETLKTSYVPMALRMSSYNALNALSVYLKERERETPGSGLFADYG